MQKYAIRYIFPICSKRLTAFQNRILLVEGAVELLRADRETLCKYVAAQLRNDKSQLNLVATGSCLHSIQLGEDKVSILVAGKL